MVAGAQALSLVKVKLAVGLRFTVIVTDAEAEHAPSLAVTEYVVEEVGLSVEDEPLPAGLHV